MQKPKWLDHLMLKVLGVMTIALGINAVGYWRPGLVVVWVGVGLILIYDVVGAIYGLIPTARKSA
jgi:hypothetical protein